MNRETVKCETDVENEAAYAEANAVSTGLHRPWFKPLLNIWYMPNHVYLIFWYIIYAQKCLFHFLIYDICETMLIWFLTIRGLYNFYSECQERMRASAKMTICGKVLARIHHFHHLFGFFFWGKQVLTKYQFAHMYVLKHIH